MTLDLRSLRHALALHEEANFSRAATRLHITQPALSRSILLLEEELGVRLFDRDPAGVVPTVAGRRLIEHARAVLQEAGNLRHEMALLRDGDAGTVSLGVGPFPASVLPSVLAEVRHEHPRLRVEVDINHWQHLLAQLRTERIEFFVADTRQITTHVPAITQLHLQPLARQPMGFFCAPAHPLAGRASLRVRDLKGHALASVRLPPPIVAALRKALRLQPHEDDPLTLLCDNAFILRQVAVQGGAVLLSTRAAVHDECRDGTFVELPVKDVSPSCIAIGLARLERRTLSPAARMVADKIARALAG